MLLDLIHLLSIEGEQPDAELPSDEDTDQKQTPPRNSPVRVWTRQSVLIHLRLFRIKNLLMGRILRGASPSLNSYVRIPLNPMPIWMRSSIHPMASICTMWRWRIYRVLSPICVNLYVDRCQNKYEKEKENRFHLSLGYHSRERAIERTRNKRIRKSEDRATVETRILWIQNGTRESKVCLLTLSMHFDFTIQERHALMEIADDAHKLQMKAQKTAEEAMNHLKVYMTEQEKLVMHCKPLFFLLVWRMTSILCRKAALPIKRLRR